jgi:hypothetical protein
MFAIRYDSKVARTALAVFQYFAVSALFGVCNTPAVGFVLLIGLQATHAAIWLGAVALLPTLPALYAAVVAMRAFNEEGGYSSGLAVRYFRAFAEGAQRLWRYWVGWLAAFVLVMYDFALHGASDPVFVALMAVTLVLMMHALGVVCAAPLVGGRRTIRLVSTTLYALLARPHVPLLWLALVGGGYALLYVPVMGSTFSMFGVAGFVQAVAWVNARLGFDVVVNALEAHTHERQPALVDL